MRRQSGILLPIFSLPSRYGIGTMGKSAYEFIDFLEASGQTLWQILPVGPTGYGDSPYQSFSTFAGNPYFVDLEELQEEGLLQVEEVQEAAQSGNVDHVEYGSLFQNRRPLLLKASQRGHGTYGEEEQSFYRDNQDWLPDYALYQALKTCFGYVPYWEWPEALRDRDSAALEEYREKLREEIQMHCFTQFLFDRQWKNMKKYAEEHGIEIIGDLPIYVACDSADTWSHPELFMLDENRRPTEVAGVPPDVFSDEGQLWGNPIYNWEKHRETGYAWWIRRMEAAVKRYDLVRIDHFRGFAGYYSIPGGSPNAKNGEWKAGPGMELFRQLGGHISMQSLIAEDLGFLDEPVRALLKDTGLPGMRVLQFGLDGDDSEFLCHNYQPNTVAYIGTHDNETFNGWLFNPETPAGSRQNAMEYLRLRESEGYHWGAIYTMMASVAQRVIFQMQDVLGLSNYARMNTPATPMGNWQWRMRSDVLTERLSQKLLKCTKAYHRV